MQHYDLLMGADPPINRRLAAILAADIAGYSRLMHEDEAATVRDLKAHQSVVLPLIGRHGGRIIDTAGDGILAEFPSVIAATECAVQIQTVMAERNEGVPEHRRMRFRIGINLGDVIHDDARIYGDGINIAARLETLAEPGGVLVSSTVYDHVRGKLPFTFVDAGERQLKNIESPVRRYRVLIPGVAFTPGAAPLGRAPADRSLSMGMRQRVHEISVAAPPPWLGSAAVSGTTRMARSRITSAMVLMPAPSSPPPACSSQNRMSIPRYIVAAAVRCSRACSRLPVRR